MTDYDFKTLSHYDFEILVRDLLQKELNITLESFKKGKDQGIDCRYAPDKENTLIVQCKHYVGSGYDLLYRKLKKEEYPKVKKLNPSRYLLATSVDLTSTQKDNLKSLLDPYCKSTGDIFGCSELNNLLGKYPDIERLNFKLWLTSFNVLDRVVHSTIYNQSQMEVDRIQRKLKYYVRNDSYFEARNLLKEQNYCIISGIPGIGKTFLAEILLIYYLGIEYEVIKVVNDISEAISVHNPEIKQIFYYDDFLGQTTLQEKLNKNEDQSLLRFIENIHNSNSSKLVLTTREYILNQAKNTYEKLAMSEFDVWKCVIDLESYTKIDRALILYNHLYYSDIPQELKAALLEDDAYLIIINHKNYNPRIIEWMTTALNTVNCGPDEYFRLFINNLDYPSRIWEHAFEQQISNASRHLLLVLSILPSHVFLTELEEAFLSFYRFRAEKYGYVLQSNGFKEALRELEDTFIKINLVKGYNIIEFHNPSIRDFLNSYLGANAEVVFNLCDSSIFFDQITSLWGNVAYIVDDQAPRKHLEKKPECVSTAIQRTYNRSATELTVMRLDSGLYLHKKEPEPIEKRLAKALPILISLEIEIADQVIGELLESQQRSFTTDTATFSAIPEIFYYLNNTPLWDRKNFNNFKSAAANYLIKDKNSYSSIDKYETVVDFIETCEDTLSKDKVSELKKQFEDQYMDLVYDEISVCDDEMDCDIYKSKLLKIGEYFDMNIDDAYEIISDRENEIRSEYFDDPIDDEDKEQHLIMGLTR